MKKFAFLDFDKTIYDGHIFFDWARYLRKRRFISFSQLVGLEGLFAQYKLGVLGYAETATKISYSFNQMLVGKDFDKAVALSRSFLVGEKLRLYKFTNELLQLLKDHGFKICLVTNEPDLLAELLKEELNLDDALGLGWRLRDGKVEQGILEDLFTAEGKRDLIRDYLNQREIEPADCIAMGDSANDIEMLKFVGRGFLLSRQEKVLQKAKGTEIEVCTKDNVLEKVRASLKTT